MRRRVVVFGVKATTRWAGRYFEMSRAVLPLSVKATIVRAPTFWAI
jgi:hypothetical protein